MKLTVLSDVAYGFLWTVAFGLMLITVLLWGALLGQWMGTKDRVEDSYRINTHIIPKKEGVL